VGGTRTTTARRYAEAVFEIAQRDDTVEEWLSQLGAAAAAVADPQDARRLEDPHVPLDVRTNALHQALGKDMLPQLGNLLGLVLRRRRVELLPRIAREYRRLFNRQAGIVEATATSAAELDQADLASLRGRLEKMTGARIELETSVDPAILGGIQVRIGDTLYDGSVLGRLERLRARLAAGAITP
jgi:F-type H+-transporting ATPase subunit delta